MFDWQIFSANLRAARLRMGLTQKGLAEHLHISTQAVSKWERCESVPDLTRVCKLAQVLRISIDQLLGTQQDRENALIAVDGGGTKTEFVLVSVSGKLLRRIVLPGSNPNTCTIKGTCDILCRGIDALMQEPVRVLAICIGCAGFFSGNNGEQVEDLLRKNYPGTPLRCFSDICNVLACAKDPDNAIAVICGTGSVVYATKGGTLLRCGGGGWRLDTLGSGYDLGRSAIAAALDHRDGSGPGTMLTALVEEKLGGKVWDQIDTVYRENTAFIASFAPLVLRAWQAGDKVAESIVTENCQRLIQLIHAAAERSPAAKQVLLGGSILTQQAAFRQLLEGMLKPGLQPCVLQYPQIWGAYLRCTALAGLARPDPEEFMKQYTQEVEYAAHGNAK